MLLFQLFGDNPALIIPWLAALLIAITVHEFSHGFAAYLLGDDTAQKAGRLSLNPLAHLDVTGSILLLLVGFGWARPVPINPTRIGKGRRGQFAVAFAGIGSNIILALLCAFGLKLLLTFGTLSLSNYLIKFFAFLIYINLALFVFNLIPIAPLDGYRMFESAAPRIFMKYAPFMEQWGFMILIVLVFLTNIISVLISSAIVLFSVLFDLNIFLLAFGGL